MEYVADLLDFADGASQHSRANTTNGDEVGKQALALIGAFGVAFGLGLTLMDWRIGRVRLNGSQLAVCCRSAQRVGRRNRSAAHLKKDIWVV